MYKQVKGWWKHLDFILMDFIGLHLSFAIAYWIRWGFTNPYQLELYRDLAVLASAFFLLVVLVDNSYSGILRRNLAREIYSVLRLNVLLLGLILGYLFVVHNTTMYSRIQMSTFILINVGIMLVLHVIYKEIVRKRTNDSRGSRRLLLINADENDTSRIRQICEDSYSGLLLEAIAVMGGSGSVKEIESIPVIGTTEEEALEYIRTHVIDEVLLDLGKTKSRQLIGRLLDMGVTIHLSIDHLAGRCPNPTVERVSGVQCITTSVHVITPVEAFIKRAMDIVGGLFGVILTGIIFLFVAPIIKKQAPGPIFFSQDRVGKNGRTFRFYKFRSMYTDAEERKAALMSQNKMSGFMFKMDDDPRIYPFGHVLRNTSLDEFPQFWNILKGDMSLVGTRPPTVDEFERYANHHKSRLAAKPGLTGLWQVSGRSDITDFEEVVRLDNEYIRNWSLMLDMEILFKTVKVVLLRKGSV